MMDWGKWALNNRHLVVFLLTMMTLGGFLSYLEMSKLEDPEVKVKQAAVLTVYPGASSHEVELEVTDVLEKSIRTLSQVKKVTSSSMADASLLTVEMSETLSNEEVDQAFEQLRRRVHDAQPSLPKGAQASVIMDGFGDVFGMFYAFTFEGFSNEEAARYARFLRTEIQQLKGVANVGLYGVQEKTINVDLNEGKLTTMGLIPAQVLQLIQGQNRPVYSGYYESGDQRMRVSVNDRYRTAEDISNLILQGIDGSQIRLGDVASVSEDYVHPMRQAMRFDGQNAIGLSIAARSGTDITQVGKEVEALIQKLQEEQLPAGMSVHKIFFQPDRVHEALSGFMINLLESIVIVIVILIFFMGWRSGVILGVGLLITVMGSILLLHFFDGTLQRVSLASFILAMGMLVDNAIVVLDGIQLGIEQGNPRLQSLTEPGRKTAMPLLGATLIAILSFLPLFLSPDTAGIYVRDLFIVLAISLFLSWVLALVMNPILADRMLHPKASQTPSEPYSGRFYKGIEQVVGWVLSHRLISVSVVAILVVFSAWGYRLLPQGFFPDMDYNQLYIEYKLPEGYTSQRVDKDLREIETFLMQRPTVKHVTTAIGGTPARYNLVRSVTASSLSYGELIVDFASPKDALQELDKLQTYLTDHYPQAQVRVKRYNLMYKEYPIELEFQGPDPAVLRQLAHRAVAVMEQHPGTLMARANWFPRVPAAEVQYDQTKALTAGLSRSDIGLSLLVSTYGLPVETFREGSVPKTITLRMVDGQSQPREGLDNASVFGMLPSLNGIDRNTITRLATGSLSKEDLMAQALAPHPLTGVTDGMKLVWEEPVVMRTDGRRSIKAQAMPLNGTSTETLRADLAAQLDTLSLPTGYSMKWEGEYGASSEAMHYLFRYYPLALVLMVGILIMLFGDFRKPLVVIFSLPVLLIGVVWGMYFSGKTFTFTAIVAVLGLLGMMVKNVIVLLDEVVLLTSAGTPPYEALIQSAKSRVRPVMLASATTILGMLPLLGDALFGPTAVVIMAGLIVASVATIVFTPLVYALLHGIRNERSSDTHSSTPLS